MNIQTMMDNSHSVIQAVESFNSYISNLIQMRDNDMLKDGDKYNEETEVLKDAYYSTLHFVPDVVAYKACLVLGIADAEWLPDTHKDVFKTIN